VAIGVDGVEPNSGAKAAGLQAATGNATVQGPSYPTGGDVITAVDGKAVTTSQELRAAITAHHVGDTIELTVVRDGKTRTVHAKLGSNASS
jgi:S1-C subfamily serine protease